MNARAFWQQEAAAIADKSAVLGKSVLDAVDDNPQANNSIMVNDIGTIVSNNAVNMKDSNVYLIRKDKEPLLIGTTGKIIYVDLIYNNLLRQNKPIAENLINEGLFDATQTFNKYVRNKGEWDYKQNRNTIYGLVNMTYKNNTLFKFKGVDMEAQDIGNHHFGFVGKAAGLFTETFMLEQAGKAQMKSGTSKKEWQKYRESIDIQTGYPTQELLPPYGDDPRDQTWIQAGFDYYKKFDN